jgi:signal transduction histidine kinase
VPESERQRIFERFYRGRTGHARSEGAGLGLSIVQAIAEAHGGQVRLDSPSGGGATFEIVLPLDDEVPLEHEAAR